MRAHSCSEPSPLARTGRRDIALVGFDDFDLADAFDPPITVLAQDTMRLGVAAAEMALSRLAGDRGRARTVRLPARLIPRGSGELPPPAGPDAADGRATGGQFASARPRRQ